MARLARVSVAGIPYHITQRGNRREQTFWTAEDYQTYLDLLSTWTARYQVEVWAYCLMRNHVHLIVYPLQKTGLSQAIGEIHRRYTRMVNFREGWRGHLWQERFASFPMDEPYLVAAARYVELNPVRAGLVEKAWDYKWSSAKAHVEGLREGLLKGGPLWGMISDWKGFLTQSMMEEDIQLMRQHGRTGRPMGGKGFVEKMEQETGRALTPQKPGPKKKQEDKETLPLF